MTNVTQEKISAKPVDEFAERLKTSMERLAGRRRPKRVPKHAVVPPTAVGVIEITISDNQGTEPPRNK